MASCTALTSAPRKTAACSSSLTCSTTTRSRAQTATGWATYLSRLEPHLAGRFISEEEAHEPWEKIHESYAERFGVDPTPGRRFIAALHAG
jgi:hypothetical protein